MNGARTSSCRIGVLSAALAAAVTAFGLAGCGPVTRPPTAGSETAPALARRAAPPTLTAEFGAVAPPGDVRSVADWAVASNDHDALPFAIVDKNGAHGYVFSGEGRLIGDTPVLVGLAHGDEVEPGIGRKAVADVRPDERRMPAGRFVSVPVTPRAATA